MSNVMCHICNGLVDRIGLQPSGVYLCRCASARKIYIDTIESQKARIEEMAAALHEVQEIYAGLDGFKPETAPEGYALRVIEQMYQAAVMKGDQK